MINVSKVTLLLCLFGSITSNVVSESTGSSEICKDGQTCISLLQCKDTVIVNIFKQKPLDIEYLKNILCGFEEKTPMICCGNTNETDGKHNDDLNKNMPKPIVENATRPTVQNIPKGTLNSEEKLDPSATITSSLSRFPAPNNVIVNSTADPNEQNVDRIPSSYSRFPADKLALLPNRLVCGNQSVKPRVVGGNIAEITEFPWTALLIYIDNKSKVKYGCAGTLISNLYIVTAAHCVSKPAVNSLHKVRLGEWNYNTDIDCDITGACNDPPVDIGVSEISVHPNYSSSTVFHADIALLRLEEPANFTDFIRPICLPTTYTISQKETENSISYFVAGWGKTEYGNLAPVLHKLELNALPIDDCRQAYSDLSDMLSESVICAGGEKGKDSCNGDSGGPLMRETMEHSKLNWYLYGVISFGDRNCGTEGHPGVYTRITSYMDWILSTIKP